MVSRKIEQASTAVVIRHRLRTADHVESIERIVLNQTTMNARNGLERIYPRIGPHGLPDERIDAGVCTYIDDDTCVPARARPQTQRRSFPPIHRSAPENVGLDVECIIDQREGVAADVDLNDAAKEQVAPDPLRRNPETAQNRENLLF